VSSLTPRAVWFVWPLPHLPWMLLIGSRHRRGSCSAAYRFARSGTFQPTRRSTSTFRTPLLGFIDRPSADTTVTASTSRPGRRPDFGSGLPRPERVPLLPFLPASAVCYAASGSEDLLVRLSAGLLHPAAGHGVHHVSDSLPGLATVLRPEGRGPCGPSRNRPLWRRPYEAFSSSVASTMPSPRLVLSDAIAFTGWRAFSPFRALLAPVSPRARAVPSDLKAFFHRGVRCETRDVAEARSLDAPLGFGSTRSRCCRAFRAAQRRCWTFRLAARTASASPDPNVEGRQGCFGPVWLLRPVP